MPNSRYEFWSRVRDFADSRMCDNYLKPRGGCDSACPRCKTWEYQGNKITSEALTDGSVLRICGKCSYEWKAIFTPAGFIQVDNPPGDE